MFGNPAANSWNEILHSHGALEDGKLRETDNSLPPRSRRSVVTVLRIPAFAHFPEILRQALLDEIEGFRVELDCHLRKLLAAGQSGF